jgi:hypothetical protein
MLQHKGPFYDIEADLYIWERQKARMRRLEWEGHDIVYIEEEGNKKLTDFDIPVVKTWDYIQ